MNVIKTNCHTTVGGIQKLSNIAKVLNRKLYLEERKKTPKIVASPVMPLLPSLLDRSSATFPECPEETHRSIPWFKIQKRKQECVCYGRVWRVSVWVFQKKKKNNRQAKAMFMLVICIQRSIFTYTQSCAAGWRATRAACRSAAAHRVWPYAVSWSCDENPMATKFDPVLF